MNKITKEELEFVLLPNTAQIFVTVVKEECVPIVH
jgi:hypothetical protein